MSTPEQETKQVYEQLREFLREQQDIGVSKIVASWVFEPPNRFDPNPRTRLKPEILIILSYLFLMGAAFAFFNLPS